MIEDKELGVTISENEDEHLWNTLKKEAEALIKQSESNTKVQKAILEMATNKLEECKNGKSTN